MPVKLLVVGGGKMGVALVAGLICPGLGEGRRHRRGRAGGRAPRRAGHRHEGLVLLAAVTPELVGADLLDRDGGAVLAVKPDVAEAACRLLGGVGVTGSCRSWPGCPAQRLEACLPGGVGGDPGHAQHAGPGGRRGVGHLPAGATPTPADLDWAEGVLGAVGTVRAGCPSATSTR